MHLEFGISKSKNTRFFSYDDADDLAFQTRDRFRIALLIPMCGAAGLWSASCIASAQLAVEELNRGTGVSGRQAELLVIDAAVEADIPVETQIAQLIQANAIDAIVGMHISAVRQNLTRVVNGRIPYIYTPLYEGGERSKGVFTIGDTPDKQLCPAIDHLSETYRIKKWALIGNDYVWPRTSNKHAKMKLAKRGAQLVHEAYLPFNSGALETAVEQLEKSGAEGVLVSLVGQDAIEFNRIFGAMELDQKTIRLSCAIEENGLLASGENNLKRLFSSASYFAALDTEANAVFREKYYALHGDRAPVLNSLGQSTYEGVQFLASLMRPDTTPWQQRSWDTPLPIRYKSARQSIYLSNSSNTAPIYIGRANGLVFDEFHQIS